MPVSLPPPTEPVQADAAEIQSRQPVRSLKFQDYTLKLHGADVIPDAVYDSVLEVSNSLSDVVRRLNALCYVAGYPACKTTFARVGNTVYVLLDTRGIDRVEGDRQIAQYFRSLEGGETLSVQSLEPRRFLANLHATRAGIKAQPAIKDAGDGTTVMDIASIKEGVDSGIKAEFGNPGTRFVGRYLGSVSAHIGSPWGDDITLGWRESFPNIGSNPNDGAYRELNLGLSRVTPWGLFGTSARKVDYDFQFEGFRIDADIRVYELSWLYPWIATFRQRLVTQLKFDRNDSVAQVIQGPQSQPDPTGLDLLLRRLLSQLGLAPGTGIPEGVLGELLNERYNSAELGVFYSRSDALWGRALQTDAALTYRHGLKSDTAVPTGTDMDYAYLRPVLSVKYPVFPRWELATTLAAQFSDDLMPQQQQWVLGGLDNLTAFLPGSAAGDEGTLARFVLSPPALNRLGMTFQPSLLLEGGTARYNNGQNEVRLADVGVRLDVQIGENFDLSVAYANDIVSDNLLRDDVTADVYFTLRMQF